MSATPSHVLITGASGAIGGALARTYACPGTHVSLFGRRAEALEDLANQCRIRGASVQVYSIDILNFEALIEMIEQLDTERPIDLVIANAGISLCVNSKKRLESWDEVKHLLDTNIAATMATVSPLIARMRARKQGHIVLMSSLAAYHGMAMSPAYCASKAALKTYGEALYGLLRRAKVHVSVVCPGFIESPLCDTFQTKKPFIMTADKAAMLIKSRLARHQFLITFPGILRMGAGLLSLFPYSLRAVILKNLGYRTG
ncbi:MAG: SDR family NAD(P)-dependent oxidoreductase [Legionellaceae bacterium]|nr:SDR family NAD(P)-dependent oxidoreductase [Legionellaceae bacterium]